MTDLRKFRYSKGLQRKFVATEVGICGKHLNDIEAGTVNLTNNIAKKLSALYNVKVGTIKSMYAEGKKNEEC